MSQRQSETREQFLERNRQERRTRYASDPEFRALLAEQRKKQQAKPEYRERWLANERNRSKRNRADPVWRERDSLRRGLCPRRAGAAASENKEMPLDTD